MLPPISPLAVLGRRPGESPRVAHLVESLEPGTVASLVGAACTGLAGRGIPCCCVSLDGAPRPEVPGGALLSLDLTGPSARRVVGLASALRRLRVDILHTHGDTYADGLAAALLGRVSALVHDDLGADELPSRRLLRAGRLLTTRFLCSTRHAARGFAERAGITVDRIGRLPFAVDHERFRPGLDREAARSRLGVTPGQILVGSVGALTPARNYGVLLEAVASIHVEGGDVRCVLAGEGPQREALAAQARRLNLSDRVQLLGFHDEVPALLSALDIFVLPSRSAHVPQSLLEALASGLAVVAGSGGPIAEVLGDGDNGLLVPPDNPRLLARIVGQLGASAVHRDVLGKRARATAQQHSPQRAVEELARVYREIVGARVFDN
jgi:glycosyltransferase involved in cell wall biosynthesis